MNFLFESEGYYNELQRPKLIRKIQENERWLQELAAATHPKNFLD